MVLFRGGTSATRAAPPVTNATAQPGLSEWAWSHPVTGSTARAAQDDRAPFKVNLGGGQRQLPASNFLYL